MTQTLRQLLSDFYLDALEGSESRSKLEFLSSELLNTKPFSPCCTSLSRSTPPQNYLFFNDLEVTFIEGLALAKQQRISRKPVNQLQTYPPPHYPKACCNSTLTDSPPGLHWKVIT